jgi:uncharacterized protein YndB with AHSA1/START domain
MRTKQFRFTTEIAGSAESIFQLVADMPNYGKWLPNSSAFGGTINVTPYPVRLGTTYLDAGSIEKPGMVTAFEPPTRISFRHTVQLRQPFVNTDIEADIRYVFEPRDGKTFVDRQLALQLHLRGIQRLLLPVILYGFRKENNRTLAALRNYVEAEDRR